MEKMTVENRFYTADRKEWRKWLSEHYETEKEIWLVYPNKGAGEPSLLYNDAVEEALCFGWIDSTIRTIDANHRAQRFTPRRKGSPYSRPNIERLIWLDRHDMIYPKIRPSVLELITTPYQFPTDIIGALQTDSEVWDFFNRQTESYRRIRIAYINDARRRPEEFHRRLGNFIAKTKAGKLIKGYGGIDKYYNI